jgi:hypothetical protein
MTPQRIDPKCSYEFDELLWFLPFNSEILLSVDEDTSLWPIKFNGDASKRRFLNGWRR